MDEAKRDPMVDIVRQQQHTGTHEPGPDRFGGTRAGAENVEHAEVMTLTVTKADAADVGRDPLLYVQQLGAALKGYGVAVRYAPKQRGHGSLAGCDDPKLEVDIRQAVAMVNTEPGPAA
jgi:hypothetical protein